MDENILYHRWPARGHHIHSYGHIHSDIYSIHDTDHDHHQRLLDNSATDHHDRAFNDGNEDDYLDPSPSDSVFDVDGDTNTHHKGVFHDGLHHHNHHELCDPAAATGSNLHDPADEGISRSSEHRLVKCSATHATLRSGIWPTSRCPSAKCSSGEARSR